MSGPPQGTADGGGGSLGIDVGTKGGDWLFKQDGLLFGPVPASVLLDKLYGGEVTGETPIAPEGGAFYPLREIPFFVVHVAKAEAKLRVDRDAEAARRLDARRARLRLAAMLGAGLFAGAVAVAGVRFVVNARVFEQQRQELADIEIEMDPPLVQLAASAKPDGDDEELHYVPGGSEGRPREPVAREGRSPAGKGLAARSPKGASSAASSRKPFDEENLTETSYDQNAINRVIASSKGSLVPCLKEQAGRDPAFRGDVPFTFTVENSGKVGRLWIDKPGYKSGPLYDCMRTRLDGWKFPSFEGERPSVSLSFRVGK